MRTLCGLNPRVNGGFSINAKLWCVNLKQLLNLQPICWWFETTPWPSCDEMFIDVLSSSVHSWELWSLSSQNDVMKFSAILALCAGNSPVTGEFPAQRPVTRSFDVFYDLCLIKRFIKQRWGWWFETPMCPLWRHCNDLTYESPVVEKGPFTDRIDIQCVAIYLAIMHLLLTKRPSSKMMADISNIYWKA